MSSHRNCTGIPANSDVAGIGVRLSIYITTLIISIIPNVDEDARKLRGDLLTAAGLNGFSLLITALIETANRSLTLYHAILITHLLAFLGIATNPTGSYRPSASRIVVYMATVHLDGIRALLCWTIYVWATAPHLAHRVRVNDVTIYVLLFVDVRATVGWLRWIFVTAEAIALFALVCTPILVILGVWDLRNGNDQVVRDEQPESIPMDVVRVAEANALERGVISSHPRSGLELQRTNGPLNTTASREQSVTEAVHAPPPRAFTQLSIISNSRLYLQTPSAGESGRIGRFLTSVYGVTMLELTIHRNKKHVIGNENQWAFGQIAPMVIAIGSLNEVLQFLFTEQNRRGKKRSECIQ
ncbi:hypothetical protein BS47DRAFT_1304054 [Hydnum rufescens UP504]|uniref:Uncharacterized protein n=1 Tax=Hydnum rufescens UP504 TaxID=1448309 RepID=A0A9P6AKE8_9AGAM|nr:hypothetical protein BS47DRAFT_1304054 [Hydnum rufescens UP504]